jgi:hypothetical protein
MQGFEACWEGRKPRMETKSPGFIILLRAKVSNFEGLGNGEDEQVVAALNQDLRGNFPGYAVIRRVMGNYRNWGETVVMHNPVNDVEATDGLRAGWGLQGRDLQK